MHFVYLCFAKEPQKCVFMRQSRMDKNSWRHTKKRRERNRVGLRCIFVCPYFAAEPHGHQQLRHGRNKKTCNKIYVDTTPIAKNRYLMSLRWHLRALGVQVRRPEGVRVKCSSLRGPRTAYLYSFITLKLWHDYLGRSSHKLHLLLKFLGKFCIRTKNIIFKKYQKFRGKFAEISVKSEEISDRILVGKVSPIPSTFAISSTFCTASAVSICTITTKFLFAWRKYSDALGRSKLPWEKGLPKPVQLRNVDIMSTMNFCIIYN